jgi:hypothetical protein
MKKDYIYWNDKGYHFFKSEPEMARDYVIAHFDMSYEPSYAIVGQKLEEAFTVKNDLLNLNLKKHFQLAWTGAGLLCFNIKN